MKLQQLMERNVMEVFGERDAERRRPVIDELYTEDCIFNDPDAAEPSVGRDALNARVEYLLNETPGFEFRLAGPPQVIQDVGRARWHFGPTDGSPGATGMDVAIFRDGRIGSLYTFLDKTPGS
jgi:hypothetical protein